MFCHVNTATRQRLAALAPIALCLFLVIPVHADSYLDALEAEAKTLSEDAGTKEKSNWNPATTEDADSLSPNLNQPGFEENLKHNFAGTYTVYTRLGDTDKASVFSTYQQNNNIDEIMTLIKKLHKDSIEE